MTAAADVAEDNRTTVDADADADFSLADRPRCAIVMRLMLNSIPFSSIFHNVLRLDVLAEGVLKAQYWRRSGDGVTGHGPEEFQSC